VVYPASHRAPAHRAPPSIPGKTEDVFGAPFATNSISIEPNWSSKLTSPRRGPQEVLRNRELAQADLDTLRALFSRIRIPWRYFLAESLFLQISIPEIAAIVSNSRKYATDPRERFEATRNFFKTIILYGPDSPEGNAIITRVNQVHRDMGINPQSPAFSFVLYTLSCGFIDSIRRNSTHRPCPEDELALYRLMRRVSEKMGSDPLPLSYSDFVEANERFKRESWATASPTSEAVARSLLGNALARVPAAMRPFVRAAILSLVSTEVLTQLKLSQPSSLVRLAMRALFCSIA
jgi:hypothetical protein